MQARRDTQVLMDFQPVLVLTVAELEPSGNGSGASITICSALPVLVHQAAMDCAVGSILLNDWLIDC